MLLFVVGSFANSILSNFRRADVCVPLLSRAPLMQPMHPMHPTSESNSALTRGSTFNDRTRKKVRANLEGNEDHSIFIGNRTLENVYCRMNILQCTYILRNVTCIEGVLLLWEKIAIELGRQTLKRSRLKYEEDNIWKYTRNVKNLLARSLEVYNH